MRRNVNDKKFQNIIISERKEVYEEPKYLHLHDYRDKCKETQSGDHIYVNNICICGKVIDIIEEDEEEYDEEGEPCLKSNTGNHHYVGANSNCYYCGKTKTNWMLVRKSTRKIFKRVVSCKSIEIEGNIIEEESIKQWIVYKLFIKII